MAVAIGCLVLLLSSFVSLGNEEDWREASLTFYGNHDYNGDKDKLSDGTCSCAKAKAYGICYNNWCFDTIVNKSMVTAINTAGNNNTRLCGKCVEIRCVQGRYRGLDGAMYGRKSVCYDTNKSIIVQITDSCPELHPNPTNRVFCNITHRHFDLSFWAFGLLAPHKYGVVDAKFRFVPCTQEGTTNRHCCDSDSKEVCEYGDA